MNPQADNQAATKKPRVEVSELERLRGLLDKPDVIFEDNVSDLVQAFLNQNGKPLDVVTFLSNNYKGLPFSVDALKESLNMFQTEDKTEDVVRKSLSNLILQNFELIEDKELDNEFIKKITKNKIWREMIYKLSEQYNDNSFIKKAIKEIVLTTPNPIEMLQSNTVTKLFDIYLKVVFEIINKIKNFSNNLTLKINDLDYIYTTEILIKLKQIVLCDKRAYLFTLTILKKLKMEKEKKCCCFIESLVFERIINDLINNVSKNQKNIYSIQNIETTILYGNEKNNEKIKLLREATTSSNFSISDYKSLYEYIKQNILNDHELKILRNEEYISHLLKLLYIPDATSSAYSSKQVSRKDSKGFGDFVQDYATWILSFTTTYQTYLEDSKKEENGQEIDNIYNILKEIHNKLLFNPSLTELSQFIVSVMCHLDIPIVCHALIYYTKYIIQKTGFYETYYRTNEMPVLNKLLEEIARKHVLLRPKIFTVLKGFIDNPPSNFNSMTLIQIRKMLLTNMIYLTKLGYAVPFIDYINENIIIWDESLVYYSAKTIIKIISKPYSPLFASKIIHLMHNITTKLMEHTSELELLLLCRELTENLVKNDSYISNTESSEPIYSMGKCVEKGTEFLKVLQKKMK